MEKLLFLEGKREMGEVELWVWVLLKSSINKKPIPKFQEKPKHPEIGVKKISLFIPQISRLRQL